MKTVRSRGIAMLEGLDKIDWGRLSHAYGTADDVPGSIRGLASADADVRTKSIHALHATICHQGSRYRASAPAIPFLFELLEAPGAPDRVPLIQLLVGLAVGYPEWHVPLGFDPSAAFAEVDELGTPEERDRIRSAAPEEEDDWEPGRLALWQQDAYEAVLRRVAVFQDLTRDPDRLVRIESAKALAWFPEAAAESARRVRAILDGGSEPDEQANAIFGLGILDHYQGEKSDVARLVDLTSATRPQLVRLAAAISLAVLLGKTAPPGTLDVLLEAAQQPRQTSAMGSAVCWHWLGSLGHAASAIMLIQPPPTEPVFSALCRAAERVYEPMAGAEVFSALLSLAIPDPSQIGRDPGTGFYRLDPTRLTPEQRRAVEAIGRSAVWDVEPFFYGRLMDVGVIYGLPWQPDQYRAFLQAARGDAMGAPGG